MQTDTIPVGTFFGDFTPEQYAAIKHVEEWGNWLILNHPEITEVYKQGGETCTYLRVAQQFLPCAEKFPQVASRAVGYAIRKLMPPEELAEITKTRSGARLEDLFGGYDSDVFSEHCTKATLRRHELGIPVDTNAMVTGRGRTPWSKEERAETLELAGNTSYQHQVGSHKGTPDYELIAKELNTKYHNGMLVRYANSAASVVRDSRRKAK